MLSNNKNLVKEKKQCYNGLQNTNNYKYTNSYICIEFVICREIMKQDIHPQYYPKATVKCACGNTFTIGSTKPEIQVEICYACHPFYTGKKVLIDTAGRVEKFKARRAKAAIVSKPIKKIRKTKKIKITNE